jgi:hypothetical protein
MRWASKGVYKLSQDYKRLTIKEYWTPHETAIVLGRNSKFWRDLFDQKKVGGYSHFSKKGRRYRKIKADSAREYLESLSNERPETEVILPEARNFNSRDAVRQLLSEMEA